MNSDKLETCPDCRVTLPKFDGPTHRYIGASPACWALYSNLLNAGEPPIAPAPYNSLLIDAYAAQHHGVPSNQATQSVAVHLLVLHGVFAEGAETGNALWIRRRALRGDKKTVHKRFQWLTPPSFEKCLNVADIVNAPTPAERAVQMRAYVADVYNFWAEEHQATLSRWYAQHVIAD